MSSIRETIKQRSTAAPERVTIDRIGTVGIRRLKTGEMLELSRLPNDQGGLAMVAACVLDDDRKPVFDSPDDARETDWQTMQALLRECQRVNGLGAKVEDASKN